MDIISSILNIVSCLCTSNGANMCYLCGLRKNQDALNTAMEELKDAKDDVKRRVDEAENNPNGPMKCNQEVNGWLQRVQAIEGEVVQVLQKAEQEIQGRCFGGYCPINCWSSQKIGKLVIRKLAIVNDLRSKGSFGDVAYKLPPPLVQKAPEDSTVGMESMFDKVWRSIAEDEVSIMGLYGYGGVGKTTLLKQINNEFLKSTTHGFEVVLLVVVSKALNIDAIQMQIGKRLGLSSPDRTSIFSALTKKNFVLLLDDIWERVDLQSIGVPHPENSRSKVIFTTRAETLCGHMDANKKFRVECLSWDEAWTLFQEKVGNEALKSHPNVPELAKIVARECGGLPLALITIGRAMSTKKTLEEWNHAITTLQRSASEFPGMGDEVLPLLKLSYDSLRNDTVKFCFLYCALFPEDKSIEKAKLIDYWIGEGFLNEFDHIDEARNHGHDIIGILKGACLLESGYYGESHVKMHDTIRDLALWIAHECGSKRDKMLAIKAFDVTSERSCYNAERIYYIHLPWDGMEVLPLKSPNLLTLISGWPFGTIPQNFFIYMPLLRVLDLSHCSMKTFPISITELLELQYLKSSWTYIESLPKEFRKLVKLQYLDLSHMPGLKTIPSGVISSLIELRVLNLYGCDRVTDWDIEEVHKLKHLNDLGITINTQQNLSKLLSSGNQNLQLCTRRLFLVDSTIKRSSPTTLGVDSTIKRLEKLELLSNLGTLTLECLSGSMNIGVLENHCFQNLTVISILSCNELKDLRWIVFVENLKSLEVKCCDDLEEIIVVDDDFGGKIIVDVFKRLETLSMFHLPKLKSICRNALAFPCLVSMEVFGCPQLKILPFNSGSNVNNTLQGIKGEPKWWSELQWEEDHDKNELVRSKFSSLF